MIAYNTTWLNNLYNRHQLQNAFEKNAITSREKTLASDLFSVEFYTPHYFIRIGLFILTAIIAFFSFGFVAFIFRENIEQLIGSILLITGLACYAALEFFVLSKNHYRSGVDDALLWLAVAGIVAGIYWLGNKTSTGNALLIFLLALYGTLRFTDSMMSAVASLALFAWVFFIYSPLGSFAKATTPFVMMLSSVLLYVAGNYLLKYKQYRLYHQAGIITCMVSLFCLYAAANYYVVRELSITFFHLTLKNNEPIPFGWLFWIFTCVIPIVYIVSGLRKKDTVLLRIGLILISAMVATVRYYYAILPIETALLLAGVCLTAVAYAVTSYLSIPKYGFTAAATKDTNAMDSKQLEALIIAQTFSSLPKPAQGGSFGGGDFGGGGASGEF